MIWLTQARANMPSYYVDMHRIGPTYKGQMVNPQHQIQEGQKLKNILFDAYYLF